MEFTLDMGCPNNCAYCPQGILLKRYGAGKRSMNLAGFKKLLENIPRDIDLHFAGFG
jgi:hypothetical protein